tara:strand:- start:524 stop:877 length:354 start_codon:yes stop_codon:yes gene_type:complete
MKEIITTALINVSIIGMAYAGINIDERFLDLYQFVMWGFVLLATVALFIPSKDLFKTATNNKYKTFFGWCFSIVKIFVSVWVGMGVLAAFYLLITILCYVKKKMYFDELTTSNKTGE